MEFSSDYLLAWMTSRENKNNRAHAENLGNIIVNIGLRGLLHQMPLRMCLIQGSWSQ
jgi:hypothetical protein